MLTPLPRLARAAAPAGPSPLLLTAGGDLPGVGSLASALAPSSGPCDRLAAELEPHLHLSRSSHTARQVEALLQLPPRRLLQAMEQVRGPGVSAPAGPRCREAGYRRDEFWAWALAPASAAAPVALPL